MNLLNMNCHLLMIWICCLLGFAKSYGQDIKFGDKKIIPVSVDASTQTLLEKHTIRVTKDSSIKTFDEPTFAKIGDLNFTNGTIKLKVLSKLVKGAPPFSRGFIGLAFRIDSTNKIFECIYLRPANGRDSSQVRRNHTIQYFSFPDYKFERLRKDSPEKYESYADMGLNEWIEITIVVKGVHAELFLNHNDQPSLVVNDLKHGANATGSIGLWVDVGTEGYFSDLQIFPNE